MDLVTRLDLTIPLIQAPMAGVSTPALAAAVSEAGGLGSIALGASDVGGARAMIADLRARTDRAFNVNLFVHPAPRRDPQKEAAWLDRLRPLYAEFGAEPPASLRPAYLSFNDDPAMQALVIELAPPVVSFHFGLPAPDIVTALKARGSILLATATTPGEAATVERAGMDAVVAQGIAAGGHRGMFDPSAPDPAFDTAALTRLLVRQGGLPVIAAGGIMDGAGIAAALDRGAVAAQLGTAFIACPETAASPAYRAALASPGAADTRFTSAISGRPARALPSRFVAMMADEAAVPDYPVAYDAAKALHAAAVAQGNSDFAAHWAGQGAPQARAMPAAELVAVLRQELAAATAR